MRWPLAIQVLDDVQQLPGPLRRCCATPARPPRFAERIGPSAVARPGYVAPVLLQVNRRQNDSGCDNGNLGERHRPTRGTDRGIEGGQMRRRNETLV